MNQRIYFIVFCIAGMIVGLSPPATASDPRTIGWAEHALILPEMLKLRAKLDTGAETTSINAPQFTRFERNGRPWVRFSLRDRKGNSAEFERPIIRTVKVKRSDLDGLYRPVVMLALCIGGIFREESVTLSNRSKLRYPLLIGRSAMRGRFMVDSSRKYTADPECVPRP